MWIERLLALLTTFEIAQYKTDTIAGQLEKNEDKTAHEHYINRTEKSTDEATRKLLDND